MPLVMVAGHPCSGKTTASQALLALALDAHVQARMVSENEVCPGRVESYRCAPRRHGRPAAPFGRAR